MNFFYEDVFRELDNSKVRYIVVGGVACVLHGIVRLTADLDIIVELSEENLRKFIEAFKRLGYLPKFPVKIEDFTNKNKREKWIKEKKVKVFTFFHPEFHNRLIDIFMEEVIPFHELDKEKVIYEVKGIKIPVISIRHLKYLKKIAGRKQDIADIKALTDLEELKE